MLWRRLRFTSSNVAATFLGVCLLLTGSSAFAADETDPVAIGRELFVHKWKVNDPLCHGGDGLGPRYNEKSCVACHQQAGIGGAGPSSKNVQILVAIPAVHHGSGNRTGPGAISSFERSFFSQFPDEDQGSFVLHRFGTSMFYTHWHEHFMHASPPRVATQPRKRSTLTPVVICANPFVSSFAQSSTRTWDLEHSQRQLLLSERNTPPLFGAGLIDAIPAEVFKATADAQPDRLRGRVALFTDGKVGRFGWKAQAATLLDFTENACAVELGLDNPAHSQVENNRLNAFTSLELTSAQCQALTAFEASLPAPTQVEPDDPAGKLRVAAGERTFNQIGCAVCHVRNLGSVQGIYSDLLLHCVGQPLPSGEAYGRSNTRADTRASRPITPAQSPEWRTPPLWGCADSGPYLHDGSAETLEDAILGHQFQGQLAANEYRALAPEQQQELISFLESLHAPATAEPVGPERRRDARLEPSRKTHAALSTAPRRTRS